MKPRLISYKQCSYAQRVAIVLNQKSIEYEIEYIDLADPPGWFKEISPFGKVPILQVDGAVLWESVVINEYLDETYPNRLHPSDPVLRARNRSWIEHANQCTRNVLQLGLKETEGDFLELLEKLFKKLDMLESSIEGSPFFNGTDFSLVDASCVPFLQRLEFMDELRPGTLDPKRHPKLNAWKDTLLRQSSVLNSTVPEFRELYKQLLWKRQGFISRFLDKSQYDSKVQKGLY